MALRWPFFISPMGLFQRGMQILNNWYGGQLDASLNSGSGTKSPLKILQVSHDNSRELSLLNPECLNVLKQGMQILSGSMGQPILIEQF